ncbi:MAG: S-adenosylmethionine:tRNA ribosyltransferase-isomerase [Phototrophicaceae bacterium]
MKLASLMFDRPSHLAATRPASLRGVEKANIRLMVSSSTGNQHTQFRHLPDFLAAGDVLVVNNSATLPASVRAKGSIGNFQLNLSTDYGRGLWLAEPRWSVSQAGPLPLQQGDKITVGDLTGRLVAPFPNLERLWFIQFEGCLRCSLDTIGQPIRYGYVDTSYPLQHYQTVFARVAGSVEMPSAAYPFTEHVVADLQQKGVQIAEITLHTGVSSLEVEVDDIESHTLYPEPFTISPETAAIVNHAKENGQRIVAVGTTVVRALESGWDGKKLNARNGFTRRYIHPRVGVHVVDGLITGLHDPVTSHLAMLYTIAKENRIKAAYEEAIAEGYLWHEFGDSHLIWRE